MSLIPFAGAVQKFNRSGGAAYQIERSLRFNSADSAYLNRTPGSTGNRKTWTWSGWVKRTNLGSSGDIFASYSASNDNSNFEFRFNASDQLQITLWSGSTTTTSVYRDVSAWYHIVLTIDTTSASNKCRLWVNGVEVTAFAADYVETVSLNADLAINTTAAHYIGRWYISDGGNYFLKGYLTEVNFIDGSALDPTSFGEFNATTGVWQPKAYEGEYGTNGFYLDFSDNSGTTSSTLGKDQAGSNDWTPNNFSVTAGAGNDSLVDVPTRYGDDTGAGGEVRGNYNTINPLDKGSGLTISNGNLDHLADGSGNWYQARSTISIPSSGKWYWEFTFSAGTAGFCAAGMSASTIALTMGFGPGTYGDTYMMTLDGTLYTNNSSTSSYGSSFTSGDVLMVAFDRDNSKIYFGKNGTWFNSSNPETQTNPAASSISTTATLFPGVGAVNSSGGSSNFGARPFAYTAPSGFKALCTTNLPEPTIADGGEYFNTVEYPGNGGTPQSIPGVGFQPDWTWIKSTNAAFNHRVYDVVRGVGKELYTNTTDAEVTDANSLTSFNSDGFSVGTDLDVNQTSTNYVAWNWKAGGAGVTNTDGTITSTVSVNPTAGFSIVTYTGNSTAGATIGHGLGIAPSLIITKTRSTSLGNWGIYHGSLGATKALNLNSTLAAATSSLWWNNTAPTSSVFTVSTSNDVNGASTYVAYCFAPVAGYSAFGSYTGNGSADGPFVFLGFRPRFLLIKSSTDGTAPWFLYDSARDTYNVAGTEVYANASSAESSGNGRFDFLSNGFKSRVSGANNCNISGQTYIYAAFSEVAFNYALAR